MLLISDILQVKEQVTFFLDFIREVMLPLHQYYTDTEFYNHVVSRAKNRGEKHQKMWDDRAKIALIDPLIAVITARIKEGHALYKNLFAYNSARRERMSDIITTITSLLHHDQELENLLTDVLNWQDKQNVPQGLTHDFSMKSFEKVKEQDDNFTRILDTLLDGESQISLVDCLLDGTTVKPVEWKPLSAINHTFEERVRIEQSTRIQEMPSPHEFPELKQSDKIEKDQDMRFVNSFLKQVCSTRKMGIFTLPDGKEQEKTELQSSSKNPAQATTAKKAKQ